MRSNCPGGELFRSEEKAACRQCDLASQRKSGASTALNIVPANRLTCCNPVSKLATIPLQDRTSRSLQFQYLFWKQKQTFTRLN